MNMTCLEMLLEYYPVIFIDAIEYGESIWFSAYSFNGVFRMDWKTGNTEYLGRLPVEGEIGLCSAISCYHGKLYFTPCCSGKIIEYDIQKREFNSYAVPYKYEGFYGAGQYQNDIYFWSYENFAIIRFDMDNQEFVKIEDTQMDMKVRDIVSTFHDGYWSLALVRDFCIVQNHLYIPSSAIGAVVDIDMKAGAMKVWRVEGAEGYHTICYDGAGFWLSGVNNCLVYWHSDERKAEVIPIDDKIRICDARLSVYDGSKIYYSMDNSSEILVLETNDIKFQLIQDYVKDNIYWTSEIHTFKTILMKRLCQKVWIMNSVDASLQTLENDKRIMYKIRLNSGIEEFVRDRMHSYFLGIKTEQEHPGYRFSDYIKILSCGYGNGSIDKTAGIKRTIGGQIHCEGNSLYGTKN